MIINNRSFNFPFRALSASLVFLTLIIVMISGNFWILFMLPIFVIPFIMIKGLALNIDKNKIKLYKYLWFKKSIIKSISIPQNLDKLIVQTYYNITRTNRNGDAGYYNLEYKKTESLTILVFQLDEKEIIDLGFEPFYHSSEALSVARYLAENLDLKIEFKEEELSDLHKIDAENYWNTGKDPTMGFKMLRFRRKKNQQQTQK